jgi:hypothetical protein
MTYTTNKIHAVQQFMVRGVPELPPPSAYLSYSQERRNAIWELDGNAFYCHPVRLSPARNERIDTTKPA